MRIYLLADFGSTYTKVTAVDLDGEAVLGRAQAPTTVGTDISLGFEQARAQLVRETGLDEAAVCGRFASSSAAGGLKIAAIGLVPDLTQSAARRAALGAGAKVIGTYGYEIDEAIVREIEEKDCDIVLLCGGTDGGNKNVILHNAGMLARSRVACPILVCGNRVVSERIRETLEQAGKKTYVTKNLLPTVTEMDIEPAQSTIREIFIEHIIHAKGFDKAKGLFDRPILPTPKASLLAAELLADGTQNEPGIGSLLVAEVGGATTNIHSVTGIVPFTWDTVVRGLPETRVSRTVEGDLGIRYNARTIFELAGAERLSALSRAMDPAAEACDPDAYTRRLAGDVSYVPQNRAESLMDAALAACAVDIATERHAGTLKTEFSAVGEVHIQYGKNLCPVQNVLGTGGIFKYGVRPETVLAAALFSEKAPWSLKPRAPRAYLDADYLFYAAGLLSQEHPDAALRILKKHLIAMETERKMYDGN
ncbi:MAG: glutamate mutase L [Clostridiales Family XIII bacterium]|nr:glutamate mutase L [Clostridiales Family XIII bacterium]